MTWYLMDLPEHYLMDPIIVLSLQDADPAIHVLSESRCADEVQRAPREKNGLVGSIVLYMLLRVDTMFNKMISDFLRLSSFPTSGWKETLEASECSYIKAILPDTEASREREQETGKPPAGPRTSRSTTKCISGTVLKSLCQARLVFFLQYFKLCILL